MTPPTPDEWGQLLGALGLPTYGEVVAALADARDVPDERARAAVDYALEAGVLAEDPDAGNYGAVRLADGSRPADGDEGGAEAGERGAGDIEERALDAFAVAIDYFAGQLDRDIGEHTGEDGPDTPREYYEDVRGWDPETIDEKRLGYAPVSDTGLLDHLMRHGFDRDAILGTGLFYEGLEPHFRGRYVLPYFDEDGRPVYAISRSLNEDEGGHAGDHNGDQKYTKAVKTKEYSHVDEPIYGAETVDDDTDRLLVAGGIADAITLHEAGYACISPVTTVRFKDRHEPEVADLVDRHDVESVYIVNDAERPTSDETELDDGEVPDSIRDVLAIQQYGEGLRGAFGNVEFLEDAGVTPYLVDLPAGDGYLRKLDPDDYVKENWGSVETLLASAKPASDRREYTDWRERRQQRAIAQARDSDVVVEGHEGGTALFDLSITDVTGLSVGDRVDNPLGHHGDSHGYYVVVEDSDGVYGYDHKHTVAYNGLTHLLCEAGERRADDPNGRVSDGELLGAWVHAKESRLLDDDDPIPYRCLKEAAVQAGVLDRDEFVLREGEEGGTYEGFPDAERYNDALEAVRDRYDVDHGRDEVTGSSSSRSTVPSVRTCDPPEEDTRQFDREESWRAFQGERFDRAMDRDEVTVWAHDPGEGKTANAGIAALDRDVPHVFYFDKHQKAREHITDDVLPDDAEYYHLRGGEQKRKAHCMDADHAGEECPEHGHPSGCPSMCPVYDQPEDDSTRRAYEALVEEVGPNRAHLILGLSDVGEHLWHGEECAWQAQYADLDSVDHVAGVHPYMTQKSVREDRLNIIDEAPPTDSFNRLLDVDKLTRMANTMQSVGERSGSPDGLLELASFTRDVIDVITSADDDRRIEDLEPPEPEWDTIRDVVDPVGGHYVEREIQAETLAECKVEYGWSVLGRMHRDEWDGAPISINPILAAAAKAGLETDAAMKAVAVSPVLETCPWCSSDLASENGAPVCGGDSCDWDIRENTITRKDGEEARASVWIETNREDVPVGLTYRELPLLSELPDPAETLVLDATATPEKIATLFGVSVDEVVIEGDRAVDLPGLRVTQVTDGQYHASTLKRSDTARDRVQSVIETVGRIHGRPLFVVRKGLKRLFGFPENAEVLHYNANRGLNYGQCDAVVAIGAPHPNVGDLRRDAELLGMGRDDVHVGGVEHSTRRDAPNPPVYRKLNYVDEDGQGRAVATKHYTGLVGSLFREAREKDIVQSVHRIRPLLADAAGGEVKHAYLLTNVPTSLPVDELVAFDELADPVRALLPVPEGAVRLLDVIHAAVNGDAPDGFRPEQLVTTTDDGVVTNRVNGYHRLARLSGMAVCERTVYNWVDALEDVGLLDPEPYEQRRGVAYTVDIATLQSALSVLSYDGGFKVGAIRRLRHLIERDDGTLAWLGWAREAIGLRGDRCEWDPPPGTPG